MATAAQKKKFLTKLEAISKGGEPINSKMLREAIGWQDATYNKVRKELIDEGVIKAAVGGPGGTVRLLAKDPSKEALSVFISYCHTDEHMKDQLVKHLSPLKRSGLISEWHDRKITGGENFGDEISSNLESASIILLLVSIDFINSQYCYDIEMDAALKRHEEKQCLVIPIILRNCLWQQAPFAKLQALPKDARAVSSWPSPDDAYVNIAEGIKTAADKLIAGK
jgi:hypothetical protein